ncbi:MAG: hypothetical protein P0Y52_05280 [Candidatus Brevundimonas phytovorans]|nr:hypothetical protein [Brevundimonas sp.]WEK58953.1 MAG: hypothetical protein P0Y52_05280 [Brevundimonas sp.]
MKLAICAIACASLLAACATTPVPNARPLNTAQIEAMGPTPVVLAEENAGVSKSWFMADSSAAGAPYGLIGALTSVVMDAIINYGPSKRAEKSASEIAEIISLEELNASLVREFQSQAAASAAAQGVRFTEISTAQRLIDETPSDDAINVSASYVLAEDASTLRIVFEVTYHNAALPYVTPYAFEGAPPKAETTGPTYRNTFTYFSRSLPAPELTPELRERLIASIQESARDENGALPAEDTDEFKSMTKELEQAQDNSLTKGEIAIFLTREWLKDNGAQLKAEIANAHAFVARYALLDLNRTVVPSIDGGSDTLVETQADGRTILRVGSGATAGSYTSFAGHAGSFSTYGNAVSIAKDRTERMQELRKESRRKTE